MPAYRKVSVTFWSDSFVQSLTPEGKYFYLYLMTNTRTTQCGIYEITINQMVFETGYNSDSILKLIAQMEKSGKIKYSKSTNEIALKNWIKYNDSASPKVMACVERELKSVKNKVLIEYVYSIDTETQETKEETKAKPEEEEETKQELILWPSFEDFWDKYDKKVGKPKALTFWKKIDQGGREKIMAHLDTYTLTEKMYRKDPERYLKNKCWEDEVIIKNQVNGFTTKREQNANELKQALANSIMQEFGNGQVQGGG